MAKLNQNFIFWKSNKRIARFTVEDVADLVGCEVHWAMGVAPGSINLIEKSTETMPADITISGKIARVQILVADMATLDVGKYYHELLVVDAEGNILTAAVGEVDLRESSIAGGL